MYRSVVSNEQIMQMHDADWAKYMCESVYCLWIQVLCGVIPNYKQHAAELIMFSRKLMQQIQQKLHPMQETEILYRRLFSACGECGLHDQIKELYQELQSVKKLDVDKVTYSTYYASLMKCKDDPFSQPVKVVDDFMQDEQDDDDCSRLSHILENSLYLEVCKECSQCKTLLREEEVLTGMQKNQ